MMNKIIHIIGDVILLVAFLFLSYANIMFSLEKSFDIGRVASVVLVTFLAISTIHTWNFKFRHEKKNWVYYHKVVPCYLFLLSLVFVVFYHLFY